MVNDNIEGSYVKIGVDGIKLGSLANMYINTNNFKLQTKADESTGEHTILAVGTHFNNVSGSTVNNIFGADTENSVKAGLVFNANGLFIKGTVYADAGQFTGTVYATNGSFSGSIFAAQASKIAGFYIGNTYMASIFNNNSNDYHKNNLSSTYRGVYIGTDGINISSNYDSNSSTPENTIYGDILFKIDIPQRILTFGNYQKTSKPTLLTVN
jgi:hypothetical protein